jgi:exosortase B
LIAERRMSTAHTAPQQALQNGSTLWPSQSDRWALACVLLGLALLYLPTYWSLSHTIWASDDQGQGPVILLASLWLFYTRREALAALPDTRASVSSVALLVVGLLLYAVGRSQGVWMFEVGSQMAVFTAVIALFKGWAGVRLCWFPIFFLLFMVPLPGHLVATLTAPLKSAVSYVASGTLYGLGYPVARSGVVMMVGQYQLLVADACAGLTSMFTLEALGLLYLNIVKHSAVWRNVLLATLVIPVAFIANVVRVMVLVLVTYHFGDAAGQGFVHGFAGIVLFVAALLLLIAADGLITLVQRVFTKAPA